MIDYLKGEKALVRVVESLDTRDLKPLDRNIGPVQVQTRVQLCIKIAYVQ